MQPALSIAVAQTCPVRGEVEANIAEHLRLARIAVSEGARIVLFPELSLTGYELDLAGGMAFSEDDPRLAPLVEAAVGASAVLIVGAPIRLGSTLRIGAYILRPEGTVALYTKQRLGAFPASAAPDGSVPPPEASVFIPSRLDPLVDVGGRTAAVAICADIGLPSHPRRAADRGATAYLASMFVIPSDFEADAAKLQGYAKAYSMVVALANYGSPTGGLASAGRSSIWARTGKLLARLDPAGAGVAIATETTEGWRSKTVTAA